MIGEVLRVVRIANDMSIKEVSEKSNVSVSYLTDLEKNKKINPSIHLLEKICSTHNINVSELFELDEYHETIIDLKEKLKTYQLLLMRILELYDVKEKTKAKELKKKF